MNSKRKKLADGQIITYYYAWKGGPRILGTLGSPEFIASYNAAVASRRPVAAGSVFEILRKYQDATEFTDLAARTRADYKKKILLIEKEFGDFPLAALAEKGARAVFLEWRDRLAKASRRQADLAFTVLARVLSWALHRELIDANPCKAVGRLYETGARRDRVWTPEMEIAFLAHAKGGVRLAFLLAVNTAQRQGDLLRLEWSAYDGTSIKLRQSKTGARVRVPVTRALKRALDAERRVSPVVLTTRAHEPFTEDGFRSSWRKTCNKAKIDGVTFHDLRGTAVTRLAVAGCTEAEIATISGLAVADVKSIMDHNYLSRDYALAQSGIEKLDQTSELPDQAPDRAVGSNLETEKA